MEFRLDDAQLELQETVGRFCADRFPLHEIVAREETGLDRATWRALADLGVLGLLVGEDAGGSGLGLVDAAIVFEQLGSHLVPGPALWSVLAAPLIPSAVNGELVIGGVHASEVDDGVALVEHASDLDVLVVLGEDEVRLVRTDTLAPAAPLDPLDPLTPVGRLSGLAGGELVGVPALARALRQQGVVLTAALLVGLADRALEVARSYALERQQFGVPIGSFQAVKHLLADMFVRSRLAQSATYAAAAVVQDPGRDDPMRAAAAARLLAGDAAIENGSTAVQILGGMGFTWEMLPNFLLKRAWVLEHAFGAADDHALALGQNLAMAR